MKKIITIACCILIATACENSLEKKAEEKLTIASNAYKHGNYAEAKRQVDSIKILYPKAFEARKAGQALLLDIEQKGLQEKIDSLGEAMKSWEEALTSIKSNYVLEKDAAYQEVGNYFWPTQTVEKNLHRSFLRFQVSELGVLKMTSIYCGKRNIHHTAVKVIAPDGSFSETPSSQDSYETSDLGEQIEKADFNEPDVEDLIYFIYLNKGKRLRIEFKGERRYTTTMSQEDQDAAIGIYELMHILHNIEDVQKAQEMAQQKIRFIEKKREKKAQSPS